MNYPARPFTVNKNWPPTCSQTPKTTRYPCIRSATRCLWESSSKPLAFAKSRKLLGLCMCSLPFEGTEAAEIKRCDLTNFISHITFIFLSFTDFFPPCFLQLQYEIQLCKHLHISKCLQTFYVAQFKLFPLILLLIILFLFVPPQPSCVQFLSIPAYTCL